MTLSFHFVSFMQQSYTFCRKYPKKSENNYLIVLLYYILFTILYVDTLSWARHLNTLQTIQLGIVQQAVLHLLRRKAPGALLVLHTLLPLGIFVFDDFQRPAAHELILRTAQGIQRGRNCTSLPIDRIGSILVMIHVTIIQMLQLVVVNGKNRLIGLFWIIRLGG